MQRFQPHCPLVCCVPNAATPRVAIVPRQVPRQGCRIPVTEIFGWHAPKFITNASAPNATPTLSCADLGAPPTPSTKNTQHPSSSRRCTGAPKAWPTPPYLGRIGTKDPADADTKENAPKTRGWQQQATTPVHTAMSNEPEGVIAPASQALFQSQVGPVASRAFTTIPSSTRVRIPIPVFQDCPSPSFSFAHPTLCGSCR